MVSFLQVPQQKVLYGFHLSPVRATCAAHPILLVRCHLPVVLVNRLRFKSTQTQHLNIIVHLFTSYNMPPSFCVMHST